MLEEGLTTSLLAILIGIGPIIVFVASLHFLLARDHAGKYVERERSNCGRKKKSGSIAAFP
jgi:hypothetical protein